MTRRSKALRPTFQRGEREQLPADVLAGGVSVDQGVDGLRIEAQLPDKRARAQLEANPRNPDDTVDLTGGGTGVPAAEDDTVSLTRPTGLWERMADALRKWTQGPGTDIHKNRQADNPQRMKT